MALREKQSVNMLTVFGETLHTLSRSPSGKESSSGASMDKIWYIWFILAALFVVAEIFTSGFVLLWFGVGALVAGILALTGIVGVPLQIVIFLAVSILLTIASRTIFERFFLRHSPGRELKTGMDALPGQIGVVVETSNSPTGEAAVRVFGSTWRAFPADQEEPLNEGEKVIIERVEGASVYVRHADTEPSWRAQKKLSE
jgi:membrane protein implicated in regulation of membrane protease activity